MPDAVSPSRGISPRIAVIIPCYNEELTVGTTVSGFRRALPDATVYVCDNNSSDRTADFAREAGAEVMSELRQGKGHAMRRMFADVDADLYVLVDGDATYDPDAAPAMLERVIAENLDFLNGARIAEAQAAYRAGHRFGNWALTSLVQFIFGRQFSDMLSGYKIFSRRFVKSFPAMSHGFEIETELTVHALGLRMPCAEVPTVYIERPAGSFSKLKTYRDGARILRLIANLVRNERPMLFFGVAAAVLGAAAFLFSIPLFYTYVETGLVPRLPTAIAVVGLAIVAVLSLFCGLILDMSTTSRHEMKRLAYLAIPPVRPLAPGRRKREDA
ncbi:glycosyltransferase family 2 protein [Ancylobacter amanitiformis]|uniref:Glycosyltransferase involved in cell wall biosynthesis n=1 Tax=Ancylobacter amanitiformis TaxID=217069 RepID=A0ABU0LSF7_9HYPH|nr:glycosyltransferase family 2 protein [Ancylobacter amanitiformis]MDQ0511637.1 glycosyltransferase involved in cell wall biosynthesis [Ancylobacter amanitiformis]